MSSVRQTVLLQPLVKQISWIDQGSSTVRLHHSPRTTTVSGKGGTHMSTSYLLPYAPKLDKIAALYILLTYVKPEQLSDAAIVFHTADQPLPEDFIDVDAVSDYKSAGYRTATQRIVDDEPYKHLNLRSIPGMDHFVSRFDLNNSNGSLKNRFASNLFNLVNDWPRVGHNVPRHEHMMEVIETVFGVFDHYFVAAEFNAVAINSIENPFCLSGIKELEFVTNQVFVEQVCDEIEHLLARTSKADGQTRKRAEAIKPELVFEVPTKGDQMVGGAVYRTDDRRMSRHLFDLHPETHVFVMKHRTGNAVIMTRGQQNLSALAQKLNELEPGLWHHETRYKSPFLANGGETRSVTPTALTASQLRNLIVEHFRYATRSQDMIVR